MRTLLQIGIVMNKAIIKVVGTHALIIGGLAAVATVIYDLAVLYESK